MSYKFMDQEISCIDCGEIEESRSRSRFLAVGTEDKTVKLLSLDPDSCLERISVQALPDKPSSVCLISMVNGTLYLHIGLENGVQLRSTVDSVTGMLSDSRAKFLGVKPVGLSRV
jgi:splicing factor 3B subunit 3